jgi:hypothetical protein
LTATNKVRCENFGDRHAQSGFTEYDAPPGFSIVGAVGHDDETNEYVHVSALTYVKDNLGRVVVVKAGISCDTPNRIGGSGGWAGTTLTGGIERILSESDLQAIRGSCLASLRSQ